MVVRGMWRAACVCLIGAGAGWGQALPTSATIESVPLELTMPERYHVTSVLEPLRRVELIAPADGVVRSLDVRPGATVRETQEVAQLDRAEAMARLKIAQAVVKEKQALLKRSGCGRRRSIRLSVEAAEARAELAQLELDRLTLRAPFAGRVLSVPVSSGQFVLKGTVLAEVADVSALRALVPVDRRGVKAGTDATVFVEEQEQSAKVQSVVPLLEAFSQLRELAAPYASAWIQVPNPNAELEPGLRVSQCDLAQHAHRRGAQGVAEESRGCGRLTGLARSGDPQ